MAASSEGTQLLSRRSPRVPRVIPMTFWDFTRENAERLSGATLDLSDHGLRVATKTNLRRGELICVLLNDIGLCFKCCRVIWTRSLPDSQISQAGLKVLK